MGALVRETLAPALGAASFVAKRPHHFHRAVDDGMAQLVSVQFGRLRTRRWVRFTLELGLLDPDLLELHGLPAGAGIVRAEQCQPVVRLSRLVPDRNLTREFWYGLGTDEARCAEQVAAHPTVAVDPADPESVAVLVRDDIESHVLPFLDRVRSRPGLVQAIRSAEVLRPSLLLQLYADLVEGRSTAARERYGTLRQPPAGVVSVARRLGVELT